MSNVKDTIQVNDDTGEIIEDNSRGLVRQVHVSVAFRSMWCNPFGIIGQDLSRENEEIFEEVQPFAIDPYSKKLLNDSSQPKLISKGFINVHDKIQEYAKDCDIYSILERFAASGDASLLNARNAAYGDISVLPNNLNDFAQFVNTNFKTLDSLNPELAKMVIDDKVTPEEIEAKANEIYQMRLDDYYKKDEVPVNE